MWIYLIQNKNEEFTQFKRFKLQVENRLNALLRNCELMVEVNTFLHNFQIS